MSISNYLNLFEQIDKNVDSLIELHRALIKIQSVNSGFMPTGNETKVAEFISKWLSDFELSSNILSRVPERGNLICEYPLSKGERKLLLMSHSDVVPVENEKKWHKDPFGAVVEDGRIWGRGSSDCKGLLASQMFAMMILAKNKIRFNHGFSLVCGADEEHGGRYGFGWLADNHPNVIQAK